jgi:hypothetical protein
MATQDAATLAAFVAATQQAEYAVMPVALPAVERLADSAAV